MAVFQFKEFNIQQKKSAMKVGTDSILLASWALFANEQSILDIGTGTGILALMLAQKSEAEIIDGVEIDGDAFEEAVGNFENSPWGDRLFCYHSSIQEFTKEVDEKYDFIIANPPYFNPDTIHTLTKKSIARQTHLLNHVSLLKVTKKLLSTKGSCAFIIPYENETLFVELAETLDLFLTRNTRTKDTKNAIYSRSLLQFSLQKTDFKTTELILKNEDKSYSKEFIQLTKAYYLDF